MPSVEGQPWQVGAGIHNDTTTVKDPDATLKNYEGWLTSLAAAGEPSSSLRRSP